MQRVENKPNLKVSLVSAFPVNLPVRQMITDPSGVTFYRSTNGGVCAAMPEKKLDVVSLISPDLSYEPGLALSHRGHLYAYDHSEESIAIYLDAVAEVKAGRTPKNPIYIHTPAGAHLCITPDQKTLISASPHADDNGSYIICWSIDATGMLYQKNEYLIEATPGLSHNCDIGNLAVAPNGDIAILNAMGLYILPRHDPKNKPIFVSSDPRNGSATQLAYSTNGKLYIAYSNNFIVYNAHNQLSTRLMVSNGIHHFALSGNYCYVINTERQLEIWKHQDEWQRLGKYSVTGNVERVFAGSEQNVYLANHKTLYRVTAKPRVSQAITKAQVPKFEYPIHMHAAYIAENFYLKPFPNGEARETHGILHASRVTIWGMIMVNLRRRLNCSILENINETDLKLIQIAMLFHDAGREGDGVDLWDLKSADLAFQYIYVTLHLSLESALLVANVIANKDSYDHRWYLNGSLKWQKEEPACMVRLAQHVIVHDADCIDNKRTKRAWHDSYLDFVKYFLQVEDFKNPSAARNDLMSVLHEVDILIFHTGDAIDHRNDDHRLFYNSRRECFELLLRRMRDLKLNNLLALYAEGRILSSDEARAIDLTSPHSLQEPFFFKKFVSARPDYSIVDLILSFTRSPINVERRQLRVQRPVENLFSLRAQRSDQPGCLTYAVQQIGAAEAKPMYQYDEKKHHSKATALSYCDPRYGFMPKVYRSKDRCDDIGLIFPREGVLLNRLFSYTSSYSTYHRFYESQTFEDATFKYNYLQLAQQLFASLDEMVRLGRNNEGYQVLGRLTPMKGIKVCLFSDNSETAKRHAEVTVALLNLRLSEWADENRFPYQPFDIPIVYYMPGHELHLKTYTERRFGFQVMQSLAGVKRQLCLRAELPPQHLQAAHNDLQEPLDTSMVTACDKKSRTPLFYAALNGHVKAMTMLITAGVDIAHTDDDSLLFIDMLYQQCLFAAYHELVETLKEKQPDKQMAVHSLLFSSRERSQKWIKKMVRYVQDEKLLEWYSQRLLK